MTYFDSCHNLNDLKSLYRKLALENHPDRGDDTSTMQAINAEYDQVFQILKDKQNFQAQDPESNVKTTTEVAEEYRQIIELLIHLQGIDVELCGSWLWIGGDTYPHKDELKTAGCRYSHTKRKWYWHHPEEGTSKSRGSYSMDDIRQKYGSSRIKPDERPELAAS